MKTIFYYPNLWFKKLLALMGVGTLTGGLEVTDNLVRFACFDGKVWRSEAVALEPGIILDGKIKDHERFVEHLAALKAKIQNGESEYKKIDVTVAMGEAAIYNQIFSLPTVAGAGLESAIKLNMQMASPVAVTQAYSGWEIVGRDEASSKLDVLGAFADRAMVDEITRALFEAGFVSLAIESKALAIARMMRKQAEGVDLAGSYLVVNIDDAGLDFLVIRKGRLYFEYPNSWGDLADEKGAISVEKFKEALAVNLRRVMNFYLQHWQEPVAGVFLSATAFAQETTDVVTEVLALPVLPMVASGNQSIGVEWFVAMGAGLRGLDKEADDKSITLLGAGARAAFERDRLLRFTSFWKFSISMACVIFLLLFLSADFFLRDAKSKMMTPSASAATSAEGQEVATLQGSAQTFNQSVLLIKSIEAGQYPDYAVVQAVADAASDNAVTITKFSFIGLNSPATLLGQAQSQADILAFEDELKDETSTITAVNLSLSDIQSSGDGYSFSMTLMVNPSFAVAEGQ